MTVHVAILFDRDRIRSEAVMYERLCVGLAGDGVRVTRLVPAGWNDVEGPAAANDGLIRRIDVALDIPFWMRRVRDRQLAAELTDIDVNVLYAIGTGVWPIARHLGQALDIPAVLDAWCPADLRRLPRGRAARAVAGLTVPWPGMIDIAARSVPVELISHVPFGVSRSQVAGEPEPGPIETVTVLGNSLDLPAYETLLAGLSRAVKQAGSLQIFLELSGRRSHDIWRIAQRLGLLSNLTTTPDTAYVRELVARSDLILLPERLGRVRSALLEAMGAAVPVIAASDQVVNCLLHDETAIIIEPDSPDAWAAAVRHLLDNPDLASRIGTGAAEYTAEFHGSARQVSQLGETLARTVHGEVLAFARR